MMRPLIWVCWAGVAWSAVGVACGGHDTAAAPPDAGRAVAIAVVIAAAGVLAWVLSILLGPCGGGGRDDDSEPAPEPPGPAGRAREVSTLTADDLIHEWATRPTTTEEAR